MTNPGTQGAMNTARIVDERSNSHAESGVELPPAPNDAGCVEIIEVTARGDEEVSRGLEEKYPAGNSTAVGAVANFVNTIVGAGIIGLPFAMAESGLGAGILLLFLAAFLTNQSTYMLIAAGLKTGRLNYEEMMGDLFGRCGVYAYCIFAGVLSFGAMSAYLIIVGDTIPTVVAASGSTTPAFTDRSSVILLFGIFCALPLSLLKDLSKLSYTSFVSVLADLLLTFIVIFAGSKEASEEPGSDGLELKFIRPTVFAGFGAISFAFVCQSSSFIVYRSMSHGGLNRWANVTRWSSSIALVMGLTLALGGYLTFGDDTEGNILNNFDDKHEAASAARGFLAVTMVFTYPMEMYVTRHVLDFSIFQTLLGMGPPTSTRHYCITLVLWALTIILATSTDDLGDILEVFGAFGASAVGYVMPALLHIKANPGEMRTALAVWRKGSADYAPSFCGRLWAMRSFFMPVFMVAFGVVAMVAGVATAVVSDLTQTKA